MRDRAKTKVVWYTVLFEDGQFATAVAVLEGRPTLRQIRLAVTARAEQEYGHKALAVEIVSVNLPPTTGNWPDTPAICKSDGGHE